MPTEWLEALPKIVAILEKAGMLGLMVIVAGVEAWVITKYRKELVTIYHRLDLCRMIRERYRSKLSAENLNVDVSDLIAESEREKE